MKRAALLFAFALAGCCDGSAPGAPYGRPDDMDTYDGSGEYQSVTYRYYCLNGQYVSVTYSFDGCQWDDGSEFRSGGICGRENE